MAEGKWSGYFKVYQPKDKRKTIRDNQQVGDDGSYGNFSWYQNVVQGSGSRLTRYREYDIMDSDIEISRALDTIAEEMTGNEENIDEPLSLDINRNDKVPTTVVMTLQTALQHWCEIHKWHTRLFKLARNTVKYGDVFFRRKESPNRRWEYIPAKEVIGAIVVDDDSTQIIGWQLKGKSKKNKTNSLGGYTSVNSDETETENVPADEIIRFTLNDDMSDMTPFGESLLRPIFKAFKQKELIEDAIIIYRVQRAPERRVFYIDVGKMPPQRVKQHLEQIKNEIKQKKIPSFNGGKADMDTVYNPQSMSEDFFFASRPDGRGSRVETLPGGQGLGELADLEYFQDKVWRGLRVPVSYMRPGNDGALFNDGRVGISYIQELRFSLFIERLQEYIEEILDKEFKEFLRQKNILIDPTTYKVKLPAPTNFGKYRQQELDSALLNSMSSADGMTYLSKRFILERYLQLTTEEIATNESLLKEERGLPADAGPETYPTIYGNPEEMANDLGGMGDLGMTADGGADMGFGSETDLAGGTDTGAGTGANPTTPAAGTETPPAGI